jgi:hypothetical protein
MLCDEFYGRPEEAPKVNLKHGWIVYCQRHCC